MPQKRVFSDSDFVDKPKRTFSDTDFVQAEQPQQAQPPASAGGTIRDVLAGIGSGVFNTGLGVSKLLNRASGGYLGVPPSTTLEDIGMQPTNTAQKAGMFGEQTAEFFAPGGLIGKGEKLMTGAPKIAQLLGRAGMEAGAAGGISSLQGQDPTASAAIAGASPIVGAGVGKAARGMYRWALKPSTTLPTGEAAQLVETGLEHALPVSQGGERRLMSKVDRLNQKVQGYLRPQDTINPSDVVAARTPGVRQQLATQAAPGEELSRFQQPIDEFMQRHQTPAVPSQPTLNAQGNVVFSPPIPPRDIPIPAPEAQALKVGTYARTYARKGEQGLTEAGAMGQRALAGGLRDELARLYPEINPLNQAEGQLLNLREPLGRGANRIANSGFPTTSIGAAVPFKSHIAIALEKLRRQGLGRFLAGSASQSGER